MLFRVWILLIALSIAACQPDPVQDVQDGAAKLIVRKPESHNTELQALVIGTLLIEEGCGPSGDLMVAFVFVFVRKNAPVDELVRRGCVFNKAFF